MKAIATSLFAALTLAGGVAHADPSTFGDPDNVPFQGVYAPRAVAPVIPEPLMDRILRGWTTAQSGNDGGDAGSTMLATGDGSDDGTQTLLADGGGSDDNGQTLLAVGPDDGSTQLA